MSEPGPCTDGLGRPYPHPGHHPHRNSVCVRCGQAVDSAEQPAAPERPTA